MMLRYLGWAIGGTGSLAAAVAAIICMYRVRKEKPSLSSLIRLLRLVKPQLPTVWDKLFVGLMLATVIITPLLLSKGLESNIDTALLLYALSAAIVPPALEELIDRGFIQSALERLRYASWLVIAVSSLIFSLSHYPMNPDVVPLTLFAGVLFGIMTIRTKSVLIPFLLHGIWNFIVVLTI